MNKKIPKFKNEEEERKFWAHRDSTGYVDWKKGKRMVLSNLKPSLKTISLRLPESMTEQLKLLANKRDIPYQSLLKMFLSEKIREEFNYPNCRGRSLIDPQAKRRAGLKPATTDGGETRVGWISLSSVLIYNCSYRTNGKGVYARKLAGVHGRRKNG